MTNLEKYRNAFASTFNITPEETAGLKYNGIEAWDPVGHVELAAAIENTFGIKLSGQDVVALSDFEKGKEILKKYKVEM